MSIFVDIVTYNGNIRSALRNTSYSNLILNRFYPVNSIETITLYDTIKNILGDKINYSLYDLVYGINTDLPLNLTNTSSSFNIMKMFKYMRIIDLMDIFLNQYQKNTYANESIQQTQSQNIQQTKTVRTT